MGVDNSGMVDLNDFFENAIKQLGRQLNEDEVNFLQWLYNRYSEEKQACMNHSLLMQQIK